MTNDIAIRVENLSKRYYAPQKTLKRRRGVVAHLKELGLYPRQEEDYFWALKDISFEVPKGQILGIIGKNGSGKSTLLKILSRVTPPTTGRAEVHGKIGSLLEVGTGFHPDLSGRENIFMNGVLLGIPKNEITAKFDEIVDFSGIEKFIDVPVKRYSSGMYVRLAYAVASMLRTDILILDEVLAVGDSSFQEKASSNMKKIAQDGRTILFVSHNVRQVEGLCNSGMLLKNGVIAASGPIKEISAEYFADMFLLKEDTLAGERDVLNASRLYKSSRPHVLSKIRLLDASGKLCTRFEAGGFFSFEVELVGVNVERPYCSAYIINKHGGYSTVLYSTHQKDEPSFPKNCTLTCTVPSLNIGEGRFTLQLDFGNWLGVEGSFQLLDSITNAIQFDVRCEDFIHLPKPLDYYGAVVQSRWGTRV